MELTYNIIQVMMLVYFKLGLGTRETCSSGHLQRCLGTGEMNVSLLEVKAHRQTE